jgi:hypothetical protein
VSKLKKLRATLPLTGLGERMGNGRVQWETEMGGTKAVTKRRRRRTMTTTLILMHLVHELNMLLLILSLPPRLSRCTPVHVMVRPFHQLISRVNLTSDRLVTCLHFPGLDLVSHDLM